MARRALVIGAQVEGLRGPDEDSAQIGALLAARGFAIDRRIGPAASRAGILAGLAALTAAAAPQDAAVVYFSGHGYHGAHPDGGHWQCIAPTDLRAGSDHDWRGITAWELAAQLAALTRRTRNVTVWLDCCHAAELCRDGGPPGAIARALPHPVDGGRAAHLAALRALHGPATDAVDPLGNPDVVRVVAAGQREPAFERAGPDGGYRGAFTAALVDVLAEAGDAPVSWRSIVGAIRARVQAQFPRQRPVVEGPAGRAPFSLIEPAEPAHVAARRDGDAVVLAAGWLTQVAIGDR